jgi:hypothetical protein
VQHALGERTVAEERHRHTARAAHLVRERTADGERNAGADDAVGAQHADPQVRHVHGAAAPAAQARVAAHDLREQPGEIDPTRQAMAVATVIGRDGVGGQQRRHHASRHRLLPDAEVDEPRHLAGREQFRKALLGAADAAHRAVKIEQHGAILHRRFGRPRRRAFA